MTGDYMELPQSVQELADVIGREQALKLIGSLPQCGKRSWRVSLYVPQKLKADHMLVRILGWQDAVKLVKEFGGIILQPSNCNHLHRRHRNITIHKLAAEGQTIQQIAEAISLTPRQIRNILAEPSPEEKTPANDNLNPGARIASR